MHTLRAAALTALMWTAVVEAASWKVPLERLELDPVHHRRLLRSLERGAAMKPSVWEPRFPVRDDQVLDRNARYPVPVDFHMIASVPTSVFAAKIHLGTPPQPVSLILDMSSADLVALNHEIDTHLHYDHTKSSTFRANGTRVRLFEDQPFELGGFISRDDVAVGGVDGGRPLRVHCYAFMELESPDTILRKLPPKFDGMIGLGPKRAITTGESSLVRFMIDQGVLEHPEVGIHFDEVDTHVVFGGIDPDYKSENFHYFAQEGSQTWSVPLSEIRVDDAPIVRTTRLAFLGNVDHITGPQKQVDDLADALGAVNNAIPCDGIGPEITFQFGGNFEVTLTKKDYAKPQGQGIYLFNVYGIPGSSEWGLGLPILRKVYTVLDYGSSELNERVGFARVKTNESD